MKKLISLMCMLSVFALMFVGCGSSSDSGKKDGTYKVGIIQAQQHEALDAATKGFTDVLKEKLGDKVDITLQNAAGDSNTCGTIANQYVSGGYDLIMANATPSLQAAVAATGTIPIVATSVTDYATALEISNWDGVTGINVTGTADLAPLDQQAAMIKELCPTAKTVGILYCSAEANSKYQATVITGHLKKLGFDVKEYTTADSNDVAAVTTTACNDCDVIYIPTDNTMAANKSIVDNVAGPAGVPIVTGEEGICKGCGIATLSIDYYTIGRAAGEMAYDILVNGENPANVEIGYSSKLTKEYVASRCEKLKITVPSDYIAIDETAE